MATKLSKELSKAEINLKKAEIFFDNEKFQKAAKKFKQAADVYFNNGHYRIAEEAYFYAAKSYFKLDGFQSASELQRLSGNCCLYKEKYSKAREYYSTAVKTLLRSDRIDATKDKNATILTALTYLCEFIEGDHEKGLYFIKQYKKKIDSVFFQENPLISIIKNISNAVVNHKTKYLDAILDEHIFDQDKQSFKGLSLFDQEHILLKNALVITFCSVNTDFSLILGKETFERDEYVECIGKIDITRLEKIRNHSFLPYNIRTLKVDDLIIEISKSLTTRTRPNLPLTMDKDSDGIEFSMDFRSNIPGAASIGPLTLMIQLDGKYHYFSKVKKTDIEIVSPKAVLGINLTPQETPVVNQSFPLEVEVYNNSDGDASKIEIEFEFPEELRLIRGTPIKKIYSIGSNESFSWEIKIKALKNGEIPITTVVKFFDGDGNEKGPYTAEIPVNINL